MALDTGTRLGNYEVLSSLGAGGMGEVYRAKDTRLGREVAIKVLPERLSQDSELRQRLEREAKTISQLQHPNICTLFDVGSELEVDFLVMELLEGETLEKRIERGALPIDQVLAIGAQIGEAIDTAHRAGVVHRDLKPGNVMLTKTGVKVLDFGLAKSIDAQPLPADTRSPTLLKPITGQDSIIGTPLYMAPEQLEGKEADGRTDIWALGCVIYEMVTGERPFRGESQASLITAIMASEPRPLNEALPVAQPRLDWVVSRCLAKDPDRRWQSARDVAIELESLAGEPGGQETDRPRTTVRKAPSAVVLGAAGLAILIALGTGLVIGGRRDAAVTPVATKESWTVTELNVPIPNHGFSLSPNGKTLVFGPGEGTSTGLNRRTLDSLETTPIPGSEGALWANFSPDGQQLAFVDEESTLRFLPLTGGSPVTRIEAIGEGSLWGRDGFLYYSPPLPGMHQSKEAAQLWRVPAEGGEPERLGHGSAWAMLPGEIIVLTQAPKEQRDGFWMDVLAVNVETGEERVVVAGQGPRYLDPGYLVFYRDRSLWAAAFEPTAGELRGPVVQIETGVARLPASGADVGNFALSLSGDLIYVFGHESNDAQLVWVSRDGRDVEAVSPDLRAFTVPSLSLDQRQLAVSVGPPPNNQEQWILDLETGSWSLPQQEGANNSVIEWVPPDGREIVFQSNRLEGLNQIYIQPADRTAPAVRLVPSEHAQVWLGFSPDGRHVLGTNLLQPGLWVYDRERGESKTLVEAEIVHCARFHPRGSWITYATRSSLGQSNVWIRPFPGPGEPRQLTPDGGQEPFFSYDGSELFYRGPTHVMAIPIELVDGSIFPGRAEALFEDVYMRHPFTGFPNYNPTHPDGRFLMLRAPRAESQRVVYIQNWRAKVMEMVPRQAGS